MGRIGLAFKILFNSRAAQQALDAVQGKPESLPEPQPAATEQPKPKPTPPRPARSEAVTLLAALQRDARFVDFIQESIDGYSDAQVGAAVREIHRGCQQVLNRMFEPQPIVSQEEGSTFEVPDAASERYRLSGNVSEIDAGVTSGSLVHHGWLATRCSVPQWTGSSEGAAVIAPAEVQIS